MKQDAFFTADIADRFDILDHTDFIVDRHHRHQNGIRTDRCTQHIQIEQAVFQHVQISGFKTLTLHLAYGVEYCLVLGAHGNDVLALGACVEMPCTLDGQIVRLGRAGRENDFLRIRTDQSRNLGTRILHCLVSRPAIGM